MFHPEKSALPRKFPQQSGFLERRGQVVCWEYPAASMRLDPRFLMVNTSHWQLQFSTFMQVVMYGGHEKKKFRRPFVFSSFAVHC